MLYNPVSSLLPPRGWRGLICILPPGRKHRDLEMLCCWSTVFKIEASTKDCTRSLYWLLPILFEIPLFSQVNYLNLRHTQCSLQSLSCAGVKADVRLADIYYCSRVFGLSSCCNFKLTAPLSALEVNRMSTHKANFLNVRIKLLLFLSVVVPN